VASLFSSRYASQHGVNSFEAALAQEEITLAELLADQGYVAGGFSANLRMLAANGYAQGFKQWEALMGTETANHKPRGDLLRRVSIAWLQPVAAEKEKPPVLLYLQYMEPHMPYDPPEPYRSTFRRGSPAVNEEEATKRLMALKRLSPAEIERLESLYDGEVAAVDAEIRALFGELEQSGFLDHAVVVITADHGEEFGEHGYMLHGFTLFNGAMRVPLIVIAPGHAGGRVVDDNVSLVDVAPTLLELAGAPAAPSFEGRSLVPLMGSPFSPLAIWARWFGTRDAIGEIEPFTGRDFRKHAQAIVSGARKLLVAPNGQTTVFDVRKDPSEAEPLDPSVADASDLLQRLTAQRTALQVSVAASAPGQALDDATREKLRALGYHP
jgi:arylsulfatase A-like enzyme